MLENIIAWQRHKHIFEVGETQNNGFMKKALSSHEASIYISIHYDDKAKLILIYISQSVKLHLIHKAHLLTEH